MVVFYMILFFLLSWRAFYLQTSDIPKLQQLARRQHQGVVEILPKRGDIYDRNHEELAVSLKVDSVYLRPQLFKTRQEKQNAAREIAKAVGLRKQDVEKKLFINQRLNSLFCLYINKSV